MVHTSSAVCAYYMSKLQDICDFIGAPLSPDKTVGPVQIINFLGLMLNFLKQVVQIPLEKVQKAITQIDYLLSTQYVNNKNLNGKVQVKSIQKLTGLLSFICRAVPCGWPFLRRLYNLQAKAYSPHTNTSHPKPKPHHKVRLDKGSRQDLLMWRQFLSNPTFQIHREVKFIQLLAGNQGPQIFADAAGSALLGFGCVYPEKGVWSHGHWPLCFFKHQTPSIALLELFTIVIVVEMWAPLLQGKQICLRSDNEATVFCLNKKSSKNNECMFLIRHLTLTCMHFQIYVTAQHYLGKKNVLADALSWGKIHQFHQLARQQHVMEEHPTQLPSSLWPLSWKMLRQWKVYLPISPHTHTQNLTPKCSVIHFLNPLLQLYN